MSSPCFVLPSGLSPQNPQTTLDCPGVFRGAYSDFERISRVGSLCFPLPPGYCPQKMPLPVSRNVYSTMTPFHYKVSSPKNTIHSIACPPSYHLSDGVRFKTQNPQKKQVKNMRNGAQVPRQPRRTRTALGSPPRPSPIQHPPIRILASAASSPAGVCPMQCTLTCEGHDVLIGGGEGWGR